MTRNPAEQLTDRRFVGFVILLGLFWVLLISLFLTPEVPNGHGFQHARFQAMDQGGDGVARHEAVFIRGWLLGSVIIGCFVHLLYWGTARRATSATDEPQAAVAPPHRHIISCVVGGLIYEAVFALLCYSYWKSLSETEPTFVGPFPAGLACLLFGVWLIPGLFIALYVVYFDRWVMPKAAADRFEKLVAQYAKTAKGRH